MARVVAEDPVQKLGKRPSNRRKEVHHELDERRAGAANGKTVPDTDLLNELYSSQRILTA